MNIWTMKRIIPVAIAMWGVAWLISGCATPGGAESEWGDAERTRFTQKCKVEYESAMKRIRFPGKRCEGKTAGDLLEELWRETNALLNDNGMQPLAMIIRSPSTDVKSVVIPECSLWSAWESCVEQLGGRLEFTGVHLIVHLPANPLP